jgi:hypothetical protein
MLHGLVVLFFSGMLVVGLATLVAVLTGAMPGIRAALRMDRPYAFEPAPVPPRVRLVARTRNSVPVAATPSLRAAA